jgi:thymidylate kinase
VTPEDTLILSKVPKDLWEANGVPSAEEARERERGAAIAAEVLGDLILPGGIRTSPLGPGWARDIDVYLARPVDPARLQSHGWLPLDDLITSLGVSSDGRWALVEAHRVLAAIDVHIGSPPDQGEAVLDRCRRRGQVRVREVLELRALLREGQELPSFDPVLGLAARVEAGLSGAALVRWMDGPPLTAPTPIPATAQRFVRRVLSRALRRKRLVLAISGVDGSGKSTLAGAVAASLTRAGIPVSSVWTRPGMRLGRLERVARAGKKLLRQDPTSGVKRVAGGTSGPQGLASRRGAIGWTWALLVTLSFLVDVRRRHARTRGVVVYDRHLLDALVTLDFVYQGVDLRLHRALVRRFLPRAALSVYLDVAPTVAASRKSDDLFGEVAVRAQLDRYAALVAQIPRLRVLDGDRSVESLASEIVSELARLPAKRRER